MDPYSAEGELINIHNHFHQGQYQEVVDFDTSALSPENALPARVLQLRARIALGQADDVLAEIKGETSEPELEAVGALAQQALGQSDAAVKTVEKLAQDVADNVTVQILGGTVLQTAGKSEEALALLSQHQGSCEFHLRGYMQPCAGREGDMLTGNKWMLLHSLSRYICRKIGTILQSRRLRRRGGGPKIACWSTWQSHGLV